MHSMHHAYFASAHLHLSCMGSPPHILQDHLLCSMHFVCAAHTPPFNSLDALIDHHNS
jgi:hypothetical protein